MTLKEIEGRLRRLEDVEAIKRLKAQYCLYCDDGHNADGVASLFVENGVWDGGELRGRHEGREAIREFFATVPSRAYSFSMHNVLNPIITVDGDQAHGTWYLFMAATRREGNQAILNAGRYEDDYVRIEGEWKYQSLQIKHFFSTPFQEGWAKRRFI